jgi:hypothetical protein
MTDQINTINLLASAVTFVIFTNANTILPISTPFGGITIEKQ